MHRVIAIFLGLFLVFIVSSQSFAYGGPLIRVKQGASTNWAGYAALTSLTNPLSYVVSDVKGSWTIPVLNCLNLSNNTYSSSWVGMDGYSNSTVEQTGTEHDCINNQSSYYAWYEMYPRPGYMVPLTIHANDSMTAEVKYKGNNIFSLTLKDNTTNQSFTTFQRVNKALRSSAEWITEAPWSGGVLPLANFGALPFTNNQATIAGSTGSIGAFVNDKIDMVSSDGSYTKASASALTNGNFLVTWQNQ